MDKYFQIILRLWRLLKPFHLKFYLQLFYIFSIQLLNITAIYFSAQIINKIVDKDYDQAYLFAITVLGLSFVRYLISFLQDSQQIKYIENGVITYLQNYSLKNVLKLNPSQYIEDHSAIKLLVISRGEDSVRMIVSMILFEILPTLTMVIMATVAIGFYSLNIAFATAAVFVIASFWSYLFARYHKKFIRQNTENWDSFNKQRSETFQHLSLIKNSGVEDYYLDKYISNRMGIVTFDISTWMKSNVNGKFRLAFFALGKAYITIQLIYQAILGKILIGDVFAIWSWSNQAFENIGNIVRATRNLPRYFVELEKYLNIIDRKPLFSENGTKKFDNGDIVFENVSFKYPKADEYIIKNLNISIPQGKKVAFVGFSGGGKSTIIKLLLRMYDWTDGDIKIGEKSLRKMDAKVLRQKMGYVEQHVDLFDASVKENILFGLKDEKSRSKISNEKLLEVVRKSRIDQLFERFGKQGLETIIGERGVKLSGGERQRIGIARALIKNPDILIFDEATASLDTENERFIQEAIDESSKGRTTIIIAHRLSTVQNSDIIFVMDKGEVVSEGKHEEILNTSHQYQRLVHAQNTH